MLSRWQSTIVDAQGNVQPGAVLTIRNESDQSLATVYMSPSELQPYPQGQVPADSSGFAYFYAPAGLYRIQSQDLSIDWRHVPLGNLAAMDSDQLAGELGLGTAATRDVTTSATDTTAGRLPDTGWKGIGKPILLDGELPIADQIVGGLTLQERGSSPIPPDAPMATAIKVLTVGNTTYPTQIAFDAYGQRMWIRTRTSSGGPFSDWREVYHSGNLNPVDTSRQIIAGTGLTGGGNLSANRTLSLEEAYWPLGVGQTWQDVTSSRAVGTTYTNTTGRTIVVTINTATNNGLHAEVDGFSVYANYSTGSSLPRGSVTMLVPPGSTYRLVNGGNGWTWGELR